MGKEKKTETLSRVLKYVRPHRWLILLDLLTALLSVTIMLYIPILIGRAIDGITGKGQVDFVLLTECLWRIAFCAGAAAGLQWVNGALNNRITFLTVQSLRQDAFTHLHSLPLKYLDAHSAGDILSRMIADVDSFADGLLLGFSQLFTGTVTILGTLFFMLKLSPVITLVVVILTPLSLFIAKYIASHTYQMFQHQSVTRGEQTALMNEAVGDMKLIRAFAHEQATMDQFDDINERLRVFSLKATFFSSLVNPTTRFVYGLIYAAVAMSGAYSILAGSSLTIGARTSFLSSTNQYTKPFNEISGVLTELQNALVCAGRIFEMMDEPPMTPDPMEKEINKAIQGDFALNDVSFSYHPERPLIEHLSLHAYPGQRIAIVGPTGCGKTTLINLLMRFYDVDSGEILLDGKETRTISRSELRKQIGMVLQETWLPAGTVREIISWARPEATEEEIIAAAKASHAHSFIRRLPKGYDTMISETGGTLSQGQQQLLCISRVMLVLPPVLILDEATSSIDTMTEQRIQKAFSSMMEGRTSFIVAHRLSTIRNADLILFMKDGNVIEQGTHEILMEKNGAYAHLYNAQFDQQRY